MQKLIIESSQVVRMSNGISKSINFREAAPANATRDMYHGT